MESDNLLDEIAVVDSDGEESHHTAFAEEIASIENRMKDLTFMLETWGRACSTWMRVDPDGWAANPAINWGPMSNVLAEHRALETEKAVTRRKFMNLVRTKMMGAE